MKIFMLFAAVLTVLTVSCSSEQDRKRRSMWPRGTFSEVEGLQP